MPVYFARFGSDGPVKIGFAKNITARMDNLGRRLWDDMKIIRVLDATEKDEKTLHKRFSHLNIRGEWFTFSPEMFEYLGLQDIGHEIRRVITQPCGKKISLALYHWMVERNIYEADLARLLNCPESRIAGWLRYGSTPRYEMVRRLIEVSKGALAHEFSKRPRYTRWSEPPTSLSDAA